MLPTAVQPTAGTSGETDAKRFLEVLGQGECELRPIFDPADFEPGAFPAEQAEREAAWRKDMDERLAKS